MSATIKDNTPSILNSTHSQASLAIRLALEDVKRLSLPKTPYRHGQLRADVGIRVIGNHGSIKWGQRYAQYQERGMRRDGSHVVKNYTTAGTGRGFASGAIKQVVAKLPTYFKRGRI